MSAQTSHVDHHLTNQEVRTKRCEMFDAEVKRQQNLIPRIEKIEVQYEGVPENATLYLNKGLSTPFNVCQHLSETLMDQSALALVNDQLWDMHRPLEEDCTVQMLHFHVEKPFHVNRAFWRTCSFLLSAAVETAFKDDIFVENYGFPPPNVNSGSFVADVDLKCGHDWDPTKQELMVFSAMMHRMAENDLPIKRLVVDQDLAKDMFQHNRYKTNQIPSIAQDQDNKVTLYRVGDYIDISKGPMVGSSKFIGRRCTIPVAHKIFQNGVPMYRFQGVALPKDFYLNHAAYSIIEERAVKLNYAGLQATKPVSPA